MALLALDNPQFNWSNRSRETGKYSPSIPWRVWSRSYVLRHAGILGHRRLTACAPSSTACIAPRRNSSNARRGTVATASGSRANELLNVKEPVTEHGEQPVTLKRTLFLSQATHGPGPNALNRTAHAFCSAVSGTGQPRRLADSLERLVRIHPVSTSTLAASSAARPRP